MESAQAIRTGRAPETLSEQQLVDCDGYDLGCKGGWLDNAFRWVINNGGITWEASYPYIGKASGKCEAPKPTALRLRNYGFVPETEAALMQAVALQPVAVTMNVDDPCFQHYYNGVYNGSCSWNGVYTGGSCGKVPNHAVTIVGYGAKPDGTKYWIAKNSWNETWGEKGFFYVLKGASGICSLANTAYFPIVAYSTSQSSDASSSKSPI
jgi:C1A family cysteine protease